MRLRPLDWMAWILSFTVLAAFFMPWFKFTIHPQAHAARHDLVQQLKASSERSFVASYLAISPHEEARALHEPMSGTAGYELPLLAQEPDKARQVAALGSSGVFGEQRLSDRLMLAYALPGVAFFCAAFISGCGRKWPLLLPLLASGFLYTLVRHQLNETYFERAASGIDAGIGLWLSLYGLLALCVLLILRYVLPAGGRA